MISIDANIATVLVSLITAIASYITGHHVGRAVHRSGDYRPSPVKDMLGGGEDE